MLWLSATMSPQPMSTSECTHGFSRKMSEPWMMAPTIKWDHTYYSVQFWVEPCGYCIRLYQYDSRWFVLERWKWMKYRRGRDDQVIGTWYNNIVNKVTPSYITKIKTEREYPIILFWRTDFPMPLISLQCSLLRPSIELWSLVMKLC